MKKLILGFALAFAATGCEFTEELTCEVLADPNFCWTVAVEEAYACTANAQRYGLISQSGRACSFDDGNTATFTPALDPLQSSTDIDAITIVVTDEFGQCAKFVDMGDSFMSLTTASGTVDVGGDRRAYKVECSDGTTYKSTSPMDLISCGDGSIQDSRLPGTFKSGGGGLISFGISPKPEGIEYGFVDCEFAETTP